MKLTLQRVDDLTAEQQSAVGVLRNNVYPPEWIAAWEGRDIQWSPGQWCAISWFEESQAVSYVGGLLREGAVDGKPVTIGGIGGVKTHTEARGQGLASKGIAQVLQLFKERNVDFALLVCEEKLVPMYERLGFQRHDGDMIVTQHGELTKFTFALPMTRAVLKAPPPSGAVIDLMGPPW